MKILHIASIKNSSFSGVCVAVPAHVISQQESADVALLNVCNDKIDGIEHQFVYKGGNWMDSVSPSFINPDIVVFHEVFYIQFPIIARQLSKQNIPYIIIPHGCLVKSALKHKWLKKKIAGILIFDKFINGAAAIQCLSKGELQSSGFKSPKFIGTNGVNIPLFYKDSFRKDNLILTYIGRLDIKIKGLDLLLSAISLLKNELVQKKVIINIYGPDVSGSYCELNNMVRSYQIADIVKIHSEISGKEKEEVLLNTDLFIQVSRHEGMPMGILEAMSYGLPCIITIGTSLDELVLKSNAGWVAETNVESIKKSIQTAISEPQTYMQKSINARKMILDTFAWNKVSNSILQQYKYLIDSFNVCNKYI